MGYEYDMSQIMQNGEKFFFYEQNVRSKISFTRSFWRKETSSKGKINFYQLTAWIAGAITFIDYFPHSLRPSYTRYHLQAFETGYLTTPFVVNFVCSC